MSSAMGLLPAAAEAARGAAHLLGLELFYSTLLFGLVASLAWALRGRAPHLLYWLWGLVLLRLVLPPSLSLPFSARSLAADGLEAAWAWLAGAAGGDGADGAPGAGPGAMASAAAVPGEGASVGWLLLLLGWAGGAAGVALALARRRRDVRRLLARTRAVEEAHLLGLLETWRARLGIRREVRLLVTDAPLSPLTFGSLRPVVLLPEAVLRHPEPTVTESVLAHELAHVRRWDDLRLRLQHVLQALYFFHPVAWLAAGRMGAECERLCDGMVLAQGVLPPRAYGRSLLEVLKLSLEGPAGVPAFGFTQRRYAMRIRHIVETTPGRRRLGPSLSLATAALAGVLLLPMAGQGAAGGQEAPTQPAGAGRVLLNPLPGGRVTAAFGDQPDPWSGERRNHRGIDVAATRGSLVLAPAAGRVEVATTRYEGGAHLGTVVVLDHGGGLKTFYAHLGRLEVEPGQVVEAGAALGTQGATGKVTGPHLHFEVWAGGEAVDPGAYVAEWRKEGAGSSSPATP